jgi:putative PIN family toxin of toxin-antitoxin system
VKVVFDTNVVASASFWRGKPFDCLAAWAQGECLAFVSPQLLSEYVDTIEELAARYPGKKRVSWVESLTASADLVFPTERASGATHDPDDEMLLECALAAEADFIVSGDKRHLLALREFRGTRIVSCAAFLSLL